MLPCLGQQETLQPEDVRIAGIKQQDDNVTDPLNQPTLISVLPLTSY